MSTTRIIVVSDMVVVAIQVPTVVDIRIFFNVKLKGQHKYDILRAPRNPS